MPPRRPRKDNVIYANFGAPRKSKGQVAQLQQQATSSDPAYRFKHHWPESFAGRWIMNSLAKQTDDGRIGRGLAYARDNKVVELTVETQGRISAKVTSSQLEPFDVNLFFDHRNADDLFQLTQAMMIDPTVVNQAREGQLETRHMEALVGTITSACTCPDPSKVCKHAIAVGKVLSDRVDKDPELLFNARGLHFDDIERHLAEQSRAASLEAAAAKGLRFWMGAIDWPDLPQVNKAPALEDSDMDALHRAMRSVSYTSMEQLRAVSDIEDLYFHLTEESD